MRTADRIVTDGIHPAALSENDVAFFNPRRFKKDTEGLAEIVGRCPILVADNIAAYVREANKEWNLEDFPSLAPPWPEFFIEFPSKSGKHRRGVIIQDATHFSRSPDGVRANAIEDAEKQSPGEKVQWLVECTVLVENEDHKVGGPVGWFVFALNEHGVEIGNRWSLATPSGAEVIDGAAHEDGTPIRLDDWLLAVIHPALQTIAFLHCKNVIVDRVHPPAPLSKKHQKRFGRPLLRYQTIRLEVPRNSRPGGSGNGGGGTPSLHIVSGHFGHFGDCCPGIHKPHGKAFGKLTGVYWIPSHIRGSALSGLVLTDYELSVRT